MATSGELLANIHGEFFFNTRQGLLAGQSLNLLSYALPAILSIPMINGSTVMNKGLASISGAIRGIKCLKPTETKQLVH